MNDMKLKTTLLGKTYTFRDIKQVLAKANEEKTGDQLAGLAAESAQERVAAKVVLSALTLADLREHPAVPYESDEVTRIIQDDVNETVYEKIRGWTVSDLREWILDETTTGSDIRKLSRGLTAEMIAAVCKLMGNLDLIYAASKITVTAHCNTTIGLPGTLSCRLQPNHTSTWCRMPRSPWSATRIPFPTGCSTGFTPRASTGSVWAFSPTTMKF